MIDRGFFFESNHEKNNKFWNPKKIILHLGCSNLKIGFKKGKNDTAGNQKQVLVFYHTVGGCS